MNRRVALHALGVALAVFLLPKRARSQTRTPVVAVPLIAAGPDDPPIIELRKGLAEYGYVDGRNIQILYRSSEGKVERLPSLLREFAQLNVDIIIAGATPIVAAAKGATSTIPIIMVGWDYDPVGAGFVDSLRRPGANVTGVYLSAEETIGKRLELLTELLPGVLNVAVLYDAIGKGHYQHIEPAAKAANLQVQPIEVVGPSDFAPAFKRAKAKGALAGLVLSSPHFYVNRSAIAAAAVAQRFPTIFEQSFMVQAGGLISYGQEPFYGWRRAGYFVSRILAGVRPSELPVEQPREYRLVVNARTAKAIGITVPEPILLRADEVIR
jgi:putative ABC transport system substrate-binding protein